MGIPVNYTLAMLVWYFGSKKINKEDIDARFDCMTQKWTGLLKTVLMLGNYML